MHEFQQLINSLHPVRADDNSELTEFKSPMLTGNIRSYYPIDLLVGAHKFVYGSFDKILQHKMASDGQIAELDEDQIKKTGSQIVMMDIINLVGRMPSPNDQSIIKNYITNLFEYEIGKEFLAYYLAYVFDSIEHCKKTLSSINSEDREKIALNWEGKIEPAVVVKMRKVLDQMGILPPLQIEIRIKDLAKIKKWT